MKTNTFYLAIIFLFFSLAISAQDKYQFMAINYTAQFKLAVSIDGESFSLEKINLDKDDSNLNVNPLLLKVKEYQDKGWEVMSLDTHPYSAGSGHGLLHSAYLRKKK